MIPDETRDLYLFSLFKGQLWHGMSMQTLTFLWCVSSAVSKSSMIDTFRLLRPFWFTKPPLLSLSKEPQSAQMKSDGKRICVIILRDFKLWCPNAISIWTYGLYCISIVYCGSLWYISSANGLSSLPPVWPERGKGGGGGWMHLARIYV